MSTEVVAQKRCTKCGDEFPATSEFFHHNRNSKDGLCHECKECNKARANAHYAANRDRSLASAKAYQAEHRDHKRDYDKIRYAANRNRISVYGKAHYAANREHVVSSAKTYYTMNRDRIRVRSKAYGIEHRDHISAQRKAHYAEHRDRIRVHRKIQYVKYRDHYRHYSTNRRARKKATLGTHTAQQIQDLLKRQHHKCYYCSTRFKRIKSKYVYHVDHTFPLARVVGTNIPANDISYLVLTCPTCNLKKGDKFPWEFVEGGRLL